MTEVARMESSTHGGEQPQTMNSAMSFSGSAAPAWLGDEGPKAEGQGGDLGSSLKRPEAPANGSQGAEDNSAESLLRAADITRMNDAQLADLQSGHPDRIARALNVPAPAPGVSSDDYGPERISLKGLPDKATRVKVAEAVSAFRTGQFGTFEEALIAKFALQGQLGATSHEPPQPHPSYQFHEPRAESSADPEIAAIEAQIAQLNALRAQARTNYDYDQSEDIIDRIASLRVELREARHHAETNAGVVAEFEAGERVSRQRVTARYGELMSDPDSDFNALLDIEISLAERKNDPILTSPDWPEKIASRVYDRHSDRLGAGSQADPHHRSRGAAHEPHIPPPPRPGIRVPGSPVGGSAHSTALTPAAALAELDRLSPAEQEKLMALLDAKKPR